MPEEKYQRLMAVLLDACPDDHKAWLKDKLQYANSTPFRKQLKELVKNTSQILQPLIGNSAARQRFTEKVYNTRNYLTHYTDELKSGAARGDDLFLTTQYLRIAVEACLLYELGFTPELCAEMFQRHEVYGYILELVPYSS